MTEPAPAQEAKETPDAPPRETAATRPGEESVPCSNQSQQPVVAAAPTTAMPQVVSAPRPKLEGTLAPMSAPFWFNPTTYQQPGPLPGDPNMVRHALSGRLVSFLDGSHGFCLAEGLRWYLHPAPSHAHVWRRVPTRAERGPYDPRRYPSVSFYLCSQHLSVCYYRYVVVVIVDAVCNVITVRPAC